MDIERYKKLAKEHADTDYGDPQSVIRCNQAADEMRDLASSVKFDDDEAVASFASLLGDRFASAWAAFHLLEVVGVSGDIAGSCIDCIRREAAGHGPNAIGCQLWLKTKKINGNSFRAD